MRGNADDAAEKTAASRRLEDSEARYKSLFNSIDQGFCVIEVLLDESNAPVDYRFLETNKVFEKQTGLKQTIGKTVKELVPGIERRWIEAYGKVALTGKPIRFAEHSEAIGRWFDLHASRLGGSESRKVAILFTDITERKHAEERLLESEERFRIMADAAPNMMWALNPDGTLKYINKFALEFLGTTYEEFVAKNWAPFIHSDDMEVTRQTIAESMQGRKAYRTELRLRRKDGAYRWHLTQGAPSYFPSGELYGYVGSVIDIHDRKQAEEEQVAVAQQVIEVLESMGEGFFVIDKDWNLAMVNSMHEKITQSKREDTIGKNFWDNFPGTSDPNSKYWTEYNRVMDTREPVHFVEYYAPLDLWTEVDAYPTREGGISVFFRDISDRKRAEQALVESEARLSFMAESMPQKVFTATPAGEVDYFNPEWMEYTGLTFEQIKEWGWLQFIHPDDAEKNVRVWKRSIETGKPFELEHRFRRKDGRYHWHISRARAMRDEKGSIIKWIGSNTDVEAVRRTLSRKKQLEEIAITLKEQRTQLIALNEAKDEFISLASHQLRTPATGVKQYLGMVLEGYVGNITDKQQAFLEQANISNERQITIIDDLLRVAQIDAGKVRLNKCSTNLVQLLQEIIDGQHAEFNDRQQRVVFTHASDKVIAFIDQARMRMVLENVLDNASKYTPHGKKITLRLAETDGSVAIAVQDQGVGINGEDMDKLFRKFSRLDNPLSVSVGGTGLGLYWAKKIVDLHGGSIAVSSVLSKGSKFTITIPAEERADGALIQKMA